MNVHEEFSGSWLKAADLRGQDVPVTIDRIEREEFGGDPKMVIYFLGKERGLVLNKTNAMTIAQQHGDETDGWAGKQITLFPTQTDFQGKQVACLRIRLPQATGNAFDDGTPF